MDAHIQEIAYAIGTILPIIIFVWQMNKSKFDKLEDSINKRFDAIEARLDRIEQNHIQHLMQLHAVPASPPNISGD